MNSSKFALCYPEIHLCCLRICPARWTTALEIIWRYDPYRFHLPPITDLDFTFLMILKLPNSRKHGQTLSFTEELFSVCFYTKRSAC